MDISTNNALTAVSYGAVGCVGAMAAANVVLVGAGASAKAVAFVADYFKNESVAQNLRIKGDQLISLAGKYAATELKVAAALVAVGGSAALVQYSQDNANPCDKNDDICNKVQSYEKLGMSFDKKVNLTKYAEDCAVKAEEAAKEAETAAKEKEAAAKAESDAKLFQEKKQRELDAKKGIFVGRPDMPDVIVINEDLNDSIESGNSGKGLFTKITAVAVAVLYFTKVASIYVYPPVLQLRDSIGNILDLRNNLGSI